MKPPWNINTLGLCLLVIWSVQHCRAVSSSGKHSSEASKDYYGSLLDRTKDLTFLYGPKKRKDPGGKEQRKDRIKSQSIPFRSHHGGQSVQGGEGPFHNRRTIIKFLAHAPMTEKVIFCQGFLGAKKSKGDLVINLGVSTDSGSYNHGSMLPAAETTTTIPSTTPPTTTPAASADETQGPIPINYDAVNIPPIITETTIPSTTTSIPTTLPTYPPPSELIPESEDLLINAYNEESTPSTSQNPIIHTTTLTPSTQPTTNFPEESQPLLPEFVEVPNEGESTSSVTAKLTSPQPTLPTTTLTTTSTAPSAPPFTTPSTIPTLPTTPSPDELPLLSLDSLSNANVDSTTPPNAQPISTISLEGFPTVGFSFTTTPVYTQVFTFPGVVDDSPGEGIPSDESDETSSEESQSNLNSSESPQPALPTTTLTTRSTAPSAAPFTVPSTTPTLPTTPSPDELPLVLLDSLSNATVDSTTPPNAQPISTISLEGFSTVGFGFITTPAYKQVFTFPGVVDDTPGEGIPSDESDETSSEESQSNPTSSESYGTTFEEDNMSNPTTPESESMSSEEGSQSDLSSSESYATSSEEDNQSNPTTPDSEHVSSVEEYQSESFTSQSDHVSSEEDAQSDLSTSESEPTSYASEEDSTSSSSEEETSVQGTEEFGYSSEGESDGEDLDISHAYAWPPRPEEAYVRKNGYRPPPPALAPPGFGSKSVKGGLYGSRNRPKKPFGYIKPSGFGSKPVKGGLYGSRNRPKKPFGYKKPSAADRPPYMNNYYIFPGSQFILRPRKNPGDVSDDGDDFAQFRNDLGSEGDEDYARKIDDKVSEDEGIARFLDGPASFHQMSVEDYCYDILDAFDTIW